MTTFSEVLFSGIFASAIMASFLYLLQAMQFAHSYWFAAVGSIVMKTEKHAYANGLFIHFISGVVFAFVYMTFFRMLDFKTLNEYVLFGSALGFAHGLAVSFLAVIFIAEHHPILKYRQVGFPAAIAQIAGHCIYGIALMTAIYSLQHGPIG